MNRRQNKAAHRSQASTPRTARQEAELRRRNEELERKLQEALLRADHDPLTGLLNQRAFQARLHEEADRANRESSTLLIAMLDMNNFKFFNDAYGHAVGDSVLRQVAAALQAFCRSYDTVARFGGDEFALLAPGIGVHQVSAFATRLNAVIDGLSYYLPGSDFSIPLSLSFGTAVYPEEGSTRLEALELADFRLINAKTGQSQREAEAVRASLSESMAGFPMLDALVTAVDNKDRYTRKHSADVTRWSVLIAERLGLSPESIRLVQMAGLLHDIGKIGIPDAILRKPGKLTDDETTAIRYHPTMGAIIVGAVPGFEGTLDAIRHHHERWDGDGYPAGFRGQECPLTARLMAVADSYSAMTTDRPYRKGMDPGRACEILAEGSGIQWDPACVTAFLSARTLGINSAEGDELVTQINHCE